jgi:hypothetical protein
MKCVVCKNDYTILDGRMIEGFGYVCRNCLHIQSYNTSNDKHIGNRKKMPKYGFELELTKKLDSAYKLLKYDFIPTYDGSVEIEFKSPIFADLYRYNQIASIINEIDKRSIASTHIHIELSLYTKRIIAKYWRLLWDPMVRFLYFNQSLTKRVYGRFFNRWAGSYVSQYQRYVAFNIQTHYPTFEIRIAKFRNPDQFKKLIEWGRMVSYMIDNIEIDHISETISEFELKKARFNIVKIFNYVFKDELKYYQLNPVDYVKRYCSGLN